MFYFVQGKEDPCTLIRKALSSFASVSTVILEYDFILIGVHLSLFNVLVFPVDRHKIKSKEKKIAVGKGENV